MNNTVDLYTEAIAMLEATSRTFYIPITQLPGQLKEAVTSGYLSMRAIDEIEDHPTLPKEDKAHLLISIGKMLRNSFTKTELDELFDPYKLVLPEVTLRLGDWILLCPSPVTEHIVHSTATMAEGMAKWVERDWQVHTEADLDQYTYYVAGLVGLLLTELWTWYDHTVTNPELAVSFGRGLQAVNIIRNRGEDQERGVNYLPDGWTMSDLFAYARHHLSLAERYTLDIQPGPILNFCKIPLALANATLATIENGGTKISRATVLEIVDQAVSRQ